MFFRPNIDDMAAYVPGEQPADDSDVIKLNTNENPYPPSPRVAEALQRFSADRLRIYPDASAAKFRRAAADVLDVPPDWILAGNGSDDLIVMLIRAVAGPGRSMAYPVPTFTYYDTQARVADSRRVEVPFADEDYTLPVDALAEANAELTFIANPNSPTGTQAPAEQLADLAARLDGLLVVDEAYADFTDATALPLVQAHRNVVVLRTLSKGYSLAGLRIGFAVAPPELLGEIAKAKQIYNVDALACELASAAMGDQDHKNANARKVCSSRAKLAEELTGRGWRVWPSGGNFLWARPPGTDAAPMAAALRQRGILVRHYPGPDTGAMLRITVGTNDQIGRLLAAIDRQA